MKSCPNCTSEDAPISTKECVACDHGMMTDEEFQAWKDQFHKFVTQFQEEITSKDAPICPYCGRKPEDYFEERTNRQEDGKEFDDRLYPCPGCGRDYLISQRIEYRMASKEVPS